MNMPTLVQASSRSGGDTVMDKTGRKKFCIHRDYIQVERMKAINKINKNTVRDVCLTARNTKNIRAWVLKKMI